jgi:hypothetical protein
VLDHKTDTVIIANECEGKDSQPEDNTNDDATDISAVPTVAFIL